MAPLTTNAPTNRLRGSLPKIGIRPTIDGRYGGVQDAGDTSIPADVQAKLLQFARGGLAVATLRGASYLAMGGVSMGIAGSIVDQDLFQSYFGMRSETVDMTEFVRRIEKGIYD